LIRWRGWGPAVERVAGSVDGPEAERDEDVLGRADRGPALGQQIVGARGGRVADGARDGHDVDPPAVGLVDRVHRAAPVVRLDDDDEVGAGDDDPVAGREAPPLRAGA
jgi:hypothetical protein